VTGRPPFDGTTAVELMSKHAYEPIVPPEQIVSRVPKEVSAVIQRMMEKNPADRFQDAAEVVRTLEAWLGVHHTGTFSPQETQIEKLEGYVFQFNTSASAVLRGRLISGFFGAIALSAVLLAFFGKARLGLRRVRPRIPTRSTDVHSRTGGPCGSTPSRRSTRARLGHARPNTPKAQPSFPKNASSHRRQRNGPEGTPK